MEAKKKNVNQNGDKIKKQCDEWIITVRRTLARVKMPSKLSIYKVPNKLVKLKEDAYRPSIVSVCPFHCGNKELLAFEEHKWRYKLHLLTRTFEAAVTTLDECAAALFRLEGEACRCYSEYIDLDEQELVEILLVDGCFMLELFLSYYNIEIHKEDKVEDPIINNAWIVATLQHDLALLENQIPFFVLQTLFDIIKKNMPLPLPDSFTTNNVVTLALPFFKSTLGLTLSKQEIISKFSNLTVVDHLLDILHNFYLPTSDKSLVILHKSHHPISDKSPEPQGLQISGFKNSATQLLKAGIQFECDINTAVEENLLDIEFPDGVVKMSPLRIQEPTESIFRNLITFEQCSIGSEHCIASYVFLMRSLLRSSQDVEVLKEKGIIINDLSGGGGGGEDFATLFKSMCDGVVLKDFCFSKWCEKVDNYPKSWLDCDRVKAIVMVKCRGSI